MAISDDSKDVDDNSNSSDSSHPMYFVTILVLFSSKLNMNFALKLTMTLIILAVFGNAIKKVSNNHQQLKWKCLFFTTSSLTFNGTPMDLTSKTYFNGKSTLKIILCAIFSKAFWILVCFNLLFLVFSFLLAATNEIYKGPLK